MVRLGWLQTVLAALTLVVTIGLPAGALLERYAALDQKVDDQTAQIQETRVDLQSFVSTVSGQLGKLSDQLNDLRVLVAKDGHDAPPTRH